MQEHGARGSGPHPSSSLFRAPRHAAASRRSPSSRVNRQPSKPAAGNAWRPGFTGVERGDPFTGVEPDDPQRLSSDSSNPSTFRAQRHVTRRSPAAFANLERWTKGTKPSRPMDRRLNRSESEQRSRRGRTTQRLHRNSRVSDEDVRHDVAKWDTTSCGMCVRRGRWRLPAAGSVA